MQPGDRVVLTMKLKNEDSNATDWYMTNKVLDSLEASTNADANGGAYTYRLTYQNPAGQETILYDSERVGGVYMNDAGEIVTGRAARSSRVG